MGQVLVVRGGWDGHAPVATTDLFIPGLEAAGHTVRVEDSPEVYAQDRMSDVDLVVQCYTMGEISGDAVAGLRRAVAAGTGLVGWHGGIADSFRSNAEYLQLVGGQFAAHPGKHPDERAGEAADNYVPHTVDILPEAADHPVVAGVDSFDLTTEQYWVLTDDLCDVLATTTVPAPSWEPWSRPLVRPAVWTRTWGQGRICVVTPGHDVETVSHPSVRAIIERGMTWATR